MSPAFWLVLAEDDVMVAIRDNFTGFWGQYALPMLGLGILVALGVTGLQVFVRPHLQRRAEERRLWDALVAAHGLSKAEQESLRRLAAAEDLDIPSKVFVLKSAFDRQIGRGREAAALSALRAKLFHM